LRTIAVLNQKGGVGKTTTTVNAAAALAAMGQRVAVIDLDPQAHLTIHLGIEPQTLKGGSYEVLTQSAGFEESLMMTRPNLWLLAADINLVGAETELVNVVGREIILREAMTASAEKFDYCLIDCAPSLGLLSLNALAAAQEVLIPLQPHFLALQGFGKLLQTVDLVNKRINPDLKVTGVLLCMFDTRASLPNEVRADIERFLEAARGSGSAWSDAQVLPTYIRRNIKLAEAPSYGQTIFEYDPTCNGAADYRGVARFFLGIEAEPEAELETEDAGESGESQAELTSEPESAEEHAPQEPIGFEPAAVDDVEPAIDPTVPPGPEHPWRPESEVPAAPESSEPAEVQARDESAQPLGVDPAEETVSEPQPQHAWAPESTVAPTGEPDDRVESEGRAESEETSGVRDDAESTSESWSDRSWNSTLATGTVADVDSNVPSTPDPQGESDVAPADESDSAEPSEAEDREPQAERPSIEIREVPPSPPIRRYTPPPLQKFPIPPSRRQDNS